MPILTQNIKLLKSEVMADTPDGGGQMTGLQIIDGQSNNLYPDTSAMDRAFGRVQMRKVFGVAHTTDTDTLLGAHAIITDAPDDPLVHCTLLKTAGWGDDRDDAKDVIERYLVKGPKASVKIYDTHYTGSLQLRLISFVGGAFPVGGEAVVLRNPNGVEQYVRVLKVTMSSVAVTLTEFSTTSNFTATVATCELGQALNMDILGPPASRTYPGTSGTGIGAETTYAILYTTSIAGGAKFYGVKPLGLLGIPGDYSVTTTGGIYTPLVPAATIESALVDMSPYAPRPAMVYGLNLLALPSVTLAVGPGTVIYAASAITPKSINLVAGGVAFTDSTGVGNLLQGTTVVGTVNYVSGAITFAGAAPSYGSVATVLTYKPATQVSITAPFAATLPVTIANQGLVYVNAVTPLPAPGSMVVEYMAQGRWYTLTDDGFGKLSGADSSYGVGTVSYTTGSISMTLGAIPDIGSVLLASWASNKQGAPYETNALPTTPFFLADVPQEISVSGATVTFTSGGATRSHTLAQVLTGAVGFKEIKVNATHFPEGPVTLNYTVQTPQSTEVITTSTVYHPKQGAIVVNGAGSFQLTYVVPGTPAAEGGFKVWVTYSMPVTAAQSGNVYGVGANILIRAYDRGGVIYGMISTPGGAVEHTLGTIDYITGTVMFQPVSVSMWLQTTTPYYIGGNGWRYSNGVYTALGMGTCTYVGSSSFEYVLGTVLSTTTHTSSTAITYTATPTTLVITPKLWGIQMPKALSDDDRNATLFSMVGTLYRVGNALVSKGWNAATGLPDSANVGTLIDNLITLTAIPATGSAAITWTHATQQLEGKKFAGGTFRTANAPLKPGVFQLQYGETIGTASEGGVLSGGNFTGSLDATRGLCIWNSTTFGGSPIPLNPATLTYNAVFLQYLPLDASLLGLETARLPLDGKVPIFRTGDLAVVHNTLTLTLPNPLVKDTAYNLGRERLASVRVKDSLGVVVPDTLYTIALNSGLLTVPLASNITAYTQPLKVEHRIEDMLLCSQADISGKLSFTRSLTHSFPANTSFVSSAMPFGDLFARVYGLIEQNTWTSVWSDVLIGSTILAQFNNALYPIVVTNAGAIKERWVLIFTNTTSFRVVGESVGEIGTGNTSTNLAPINPATGVPYFTLPALGWGAAGGGWNPGNCLRFNTDACGTPFWAVRTVLQGPTSIDSDQFTLAFRGDVDRP